MQSTPTSTKAARKPRSDKGQPKTKGKGKPNKAKIVKLPVRMLIARIKPADPASAVETVELKAMNHTDAVAEVLKLAQVTDKARAEQLSGARVELVAFVDSFTIDSEVTVKATIKR